MPLARLAPLTTRRARRHRLATGLVLLATLLVTAGLLRAETHADETSADKRSAVVDGSAVLTAGNLHVNITNWGLIGSRYSIPSSYSSAPSAQWPGGTGLEYLEAAGLWIGARKHGVLSVSCGQPEGEFAPPPGAENVMYEARDRTIVRPAADYAESGTPGDLPGGDDDQDGRRDEDPLDGRDQDGDGLIDEDFAQRGTQMYACLMRDDSPVTVQRFPDHRPLGVRVRQEACAWDEPGFENVVGLRFEITNVTNVPLTDIYVGILVDGDIGRHDDDDAGKNDLAGIFTGLVRQPEEYFEEYAYGWMRDAAATDALPGWLGVAIDGNGFGDLTAVRPENYGVHAMRILPLQLGGGVDGLPLSDSGRYDLLARPGRDPDIPEYRTHNYALLLSVGPYLELEVGEHLTVQVALTVAGSYDELQKEMRKVRELGAGRAYDGDGLYASGGGGRETLICAEDFHPDWRSEDNPLYDRFPSYWDESCKPRIAFVYPFDALDMDYYPELDKHCVWVNTDNCDECRRYYGEVCDGQNHSGAPCGSSSDRARGACTGQGGRETALPWTSGVSLPPSPWVRAVGRDHAVEIYWDDRSEHVPDDLDGELDFQAYRIWQAPDWSRPAGSSEETGPPVNTWSLKAEYDLIDYLEPPPGAQPQPFGLNTGLDAITYRPICLDDPRYEGLAKAMETVVLDDVDGRYTTRPRLRDAAGVPVPGLESLLPWEGSPTVLDTFFAVTERPATFGVPKRSVGYYRYRDEEVHNGFL
jgi:hypothetical protein